MQYKDLALRCQDDDGAVARADLGHLQVVPLQRRDELRGGDHGGAVGLEVAKLTWKQRGFCVRWDGLYSFVKRVTGRVSERN